MREPSHSSRQPAAPLPEQPGRPVTGEDPAEPKEASQPAGSAKDVRADTGAKDINVVRGDDRPQAVRHPR